jgi:fibronectin type III domain protein
MHRAPSRLVSVLGPLLLLVAALPSTAPAGAQDRRVDAAPTLLAQAVPPAGRAPALPAPAAPASGPTAVSPAPPAAGTTPPPAAGATAPPPAAGTPAPPPAAGTTLPPPGSATTITPPASATVVPDCQLTPAPAYPPQGNLRLSINVLTRWQPAGGMVKFAIEGNDLTVDGLKIVACFLGPDDTKERWRPSRPLQVLQTELHKITFGAVVPDIGLRWWWPIPAAVDFRIMANSPAAWKQIDTVVPIGITPRLGAVLVPLLVIGVAWIILLRLGRGRDVRGGPFLSIIANSNSYASLSQLQIILWTFVIAAGAMYVMALSGDLIDIPTQALMLLGISGLAALGAQLPGATGATSAASQAAAPPPTPGIATSVSAVEPIDAAGAVLSWEPPSGGAKPASYIVERNTLAAPAWVQVGGGTTDTFLTVGGLTPGTTYGFRVTAVDELGRVGTPSPPIAVPTPAAALGAAPGQPIKLTPFQPPGETTVTLTWTAPVAPPARTHYLVQYRLSGAATWTTAPKPVDGLGYTVRGLSPGTTYDFQVAAVGNGAVGPWSAPAVATTLKRVPKWADLVVWDGIKEIDVTRVQMLLFTVITAGFVLVKTVGNSAVPDIPVGILTLMGLSNGVYLANKFIPSQK